MYIGRYTVIGEVGRGGMGVVYKAIDTDGQMVAIKLIGKALRSAQPAARESARMGLVREATLASRLHHPNITSVFDIGQERGQLYIVMEYLDGRPLNLFCRSTPKLTLRRKLEIVAELCDGLHHAHGWGVIHRDVKPGN